MGVDLYTCKFCKEILHPDYFYQCENGECWDYYELVMCDECKKTHKCKCELTDEEREQSIKCNKEINELEDKIDYLYYE